MQGEVMCLKCVENAAKWTNSVVNVLGNHICQNHLHITND